MITPAGLAAAPVILSPTVWYEVRHVKSSILLTSFVGRSYGYVGNAVAGWDATLGIVSGSLPRLVDGNAGEEDSTVVWKLFDKKYFIYN